MDHAWDGDVVRLLDTASVGWAGLRRWTIDHGDPQRPVGQVRQDPGTRGYRLRRMFASTTRLSSLPATYELRDADGRPWLRVAIGRARPLRAAAATLAAPDGAVLALVPASGGSDGAGVAVADPDGRPLVVVPDGPGRAWSAQDAHGRALAQVEHLAGRPSWIDRRSRSATGRTPADDPTTGGTVVRFDDAAPALERVVVLGLAVCRAHRRRWGAS